MKYWIMRCKNHYIFRMSGETSSVRRFLHLLYLFSGGIYAVSDKRKMQKYIYFGCSAAIVFTDLSITTAYFLTTKSSINGKFFFVSLMEPTSAIFILVAMPFFVNCHRKALEELLHYIDNNLFLANYENYKEHIFFWNHTTSNPELSVCDSVKEAISWLVSALILSQMHLFFSPIVGILVGGPNFIHDPRYHAWLFPFIDQISSLKIYIMVYILECAMVQFFTFLYFLPSVFTIVLVTELYNSVMIYCLKIQDLIDLMHLDEARLNRMPEFDFQKKTTGLIIQHQNFRRMTRNAQRYIEIYNGIVSMEVFLSVYLFFQKYILSIDSERIYLVESILLIAMPTFNFYLQSHVEQKFISMNEKVIETFNNVPWFYCSPPQRMHYLFLLLQVQQPIGYKSFGMFSMGYENFPRLLKSAYSCFTLQYKFKEK